MQTLWNSIEVSRKKIIEFGLVIFIVLGVLIPLIGFIVNDYSFGPLAKTLFYSSFAFMIVCILLPKLMDPVYRTWMLLALGLGFIMTRLIITIVYFLLITPIGLVRRFSGSETPKWIRATKTDFNGKSSYWIQKDVSFDKESAERQF